MVLHPRRLSSCGSVSPGLLALPSYIKSFNTLARCSYQTYKERLVAMSSPLPDDNLDISRLISLLHFMVRGKIGSIIASSQLLEEGDVGAVNQDQQRVLRIISKDGKWLAKAAEAYATLARIKAGVSVPLEEVDLTQCINEVLKVLGSEIEAKDLSLFVDYPDLPLVLANEFQLTNILHYLLDNASRYTLSGGKITLTAAHLGERIKVTITDTGIGIATEDQAKVFEMLFRANHPIVMEQAGLGLELFFSKHYVEYFGGKIGVESELGQGSKFWFTVPAVAWTRGAG